MQQMTQLNIIGLWINCETDMVKMANTNESLSKIARMINSTEN